LVKLSQNAPVYYPPIRRILCPDLGTLVPILRTLSSFLGKQVTASFRIAQPPSHRGGNYVLLLTPSWFWCNGAFFRVSLLQTLNVQTLSMRAHAKFDRLMSQSWRIETSLRVVDSCYGYCWSRGAVQYVPRSTGAVHMVVRNRPYGMLGSTPHLTFLQTYSGHQRYLATSPQLHPTRVALVALQPSLFPARFLYRHVEVCL
jgi:hypothetical protein